ncbi:dihydrodipicolinate synthase family protein [Phreatobacter sp. AB_2022a]|uniref:dihydrodipicolinate synthase family protein n=1 Tax=Phreatobacter sp. AB_2022a TaxID=3003134 RepID=UPI0022874D49|nr:dihydrodipicolinate synthase family protein [Phreatobacter sp. AB_2022a]MCZ0734160.1 dihydrodipicolinate synthase family protein [Phreatobacter sp. AB_2022a]
MNPIFQGLSAFPITPADSEGRVDTDALQRLVARLVGAKVDSIGLLGSTGSYPYLSRAERRRAIAAAVEVARGTPILVGSGALRTDEAVALSRDAEAAGASALLLAPVSYTPLTDREVFVHFETVAAAVRLPVCIYNNPGTTHFSFSPGLIARLGQIGNIVAVKNPAPEPAHILAQLDDLRGRVGKDFSLGYSADWKVTETLIAGANAWYSVLGGLFPEPCMAIARAAKAGRAAEARRLNADLQPLWDLFMGHSSLRVVYAAANALGLVKAAPPLPILPLEPEADRQVRAVIDRLRLR